MTLTDAPASTNGTTPRDAEKAATDAKIKAEIERKASVSKLRAKGWKVELSGGQWAVLRDPETLTERQARPLKVAMASTGKATPSATGAMSMVMDPESVIASGYVLVATFVASWSMGDNLPSPADFEPLMDLPARDYAALQQACLALRDEAMASYEPQPGELSGGPEGPLSPFGPSSG